MNFNVLKLLFMSNIVLKVKTLGGVIMAGMVSYFE